MREWKVGDLVVDRWGYGIITHVDETGRLYTIRSIWHTSNYESDKSDGARPFKRWVNSFAGPVPIEEDEEMP